MRSFYQRLFPWKALFTWLNHDHIPTKLFTHREFAFTLPGDIYLRYNSFSNAEELKNEVLRLRPSRFEIGPVYSGKPRDKKTLRPTAFVPLRRELVFDIDMTDYDEIRTCCQDKDMCKRCWGFIAAATGVLDSALREQFGYSHLLWVYSGRRGIHCWVSDTAAIDLTDDQRRAIVLYLEVVAGSKDTSKKVNVRFKGSELHPSIKTAYDTLAEQFPALILDDQECFRTKEQYEALLALIPDQDITSRLRSHWSTTSSSTPSRTRWKELYKEIQRLAPSDDKPESAKYRLLTQSLQDVVLQYSYPRLDAEVSKHRNHLLKSPFVVHPGTNRVCVPIDPTKVSSFDPAKVPTVGLLLRELAEAQRKVEEVAAASTSSMDVDDPTSTGGGKKGEVRVCDWRDTSLRPYVEMMDRHNVGLMKQTREKKRSAVSMDF
ncbi:prim-pol domain-containing protein [Mrakia frigida]|uniref:DNA primase subunit PRI1 n=1 Tax=Mrakia frigida TaxID=29902 RepID=UPI003FCC22CE